MRVNLEMDTVVLPEPSFHFPFRVHKGLACIKRIQSMLVPSLSVIIQQGGYYAS
ncbi:hypothetical protein PT129_04970 [Erysipelothrix rhusiopathiae]|nr:hypothetical protein [Erysipelothrix rhusiopathiae]